MNRSTYGVKPYLNVDLQALKVQGGVSIDIFDIFANYYEFRYSMNYASNWLTVNQDGTMGGALGEVKLTNGLPYELMSKLM